MTKIGLTSEEAAQSLKKYGNNALSKPPQQTFFDKLLDNFGDPIIRILIVALLVNVVFVYMGYADWIETAGIFVYGLRGLDRDSRHFCRDHTGDVCVHTV